nr:PIN domain-containing protein [Saccharopolyspora gloriosae]
MAQAGLVQAKWTDQILDETFRNLRRNRPELDSRKLERTRELMLRAVRDCLVTGHEPLIEAVSLPDPDDRHVLAAAIKARAGDRDPELEGLPPQRTGELEHRGEAPRRVRARPGAPRPRCGLRGAPTDGRLVHQSTSDRGRCAREVGRRRTGRVRGRVAGDVKSIGG